MLILDVKRGEVTQSTHLWENKKAKLAFTQKLVGE